MCERAAQFERSVLRFLCWTHVRSRADARGDGDRRFDQMNPCVNEIEIVGARGRAGRVVLCVLEVEICVVRRPRVVVRIGAVKPVRHTG